MTLTVTEATTLLEQLLTADNTVGKPRIDVFVGEANAVMDSDGRAHPYIVIYPHPGLPDRDEEALDASPGQPLWRPQLTCAGGDTIRALRALERANSVTGKRLTDTSGVIRKIAGGYLGPDRDVTPPRTSMFLDLEVEL